MYIYITKFPSLYVGECESCSPRRRLLSKILLQYTQQNNPSLFLSLHVPRAGLSSDCWTRCLQCCRLEKYLSFSSGMRRGNTESNGQMGSDLHTRTHTKTGCGLELVLHDMHVKARRTCKCSLCDHVQNMQNTGVHSAAWLTDTLRCLREKKRLLDPSSFLFQYEKLRIQQGLRSFGFIKTSTSGWHSGAVQVQTCHLARGLPVWGLHVCIFSCYSFLHTVWRHEAGCLTNEWLNIHWGLHYQTSTKLRFILFQCQSMGEHQTVNMYSDIRKLKLAVM